MIQRRDCLGCCKKKYYIDEEQGIEKDILLFSFFDNRVCRRLTKK